MKWREILDICQKMTSEQLDSPAEVAPNQPDGDKPICLLPIYAIGSIKEMYHDPEDPSSALQDVRSSEDNMHHPDQIIMLADLHGFDEDGNSAYELTDDGMIGNHTGKLYDLLGRSKEDIAAGRLHDHEDVKKEFEDDNVS